MPTSSRATPPILFFMAREPTTTPTDVDGMDLAELRAAMDSHGAAWSRLLAQDLDPDAVVWEQRRRLREGRPDGHPARAGAAPRADHRSQLCTALTSSAWNRRPSMSGSSGCRMAASSRSHPRPDELRNFHVREEPGDKYQIRQTLADDLVGDADVTALGVLPNGRTMVLLLVIHARTVLRRHGPRPPGARTSKPKPRTMTASETRGVPATWIGRPQGGPSPDYSPTPPASPRPTRACGYRS
jgi:hypothetical protein